MGRSPRFRGGGAISRPTCLAWEIRSTSWPSPFHVEARPSDGSCVSTRCSPGWERLEEEQRRRIDAAKDVHPASG